VRPSDELLFQNGELRLWLDQKLNEASQAIGRLPGQYLEQHDDASVEETYRKQYLVASIDWAGEAAQVDQREKSVDVSDDPRRAWSGERVVIPGIEFTYSYQFSGEPSLLKLQPSRWTSNPPRGTVSGQTLKVSVLVPADAINVDAIDGHMRTQFNSINSYLVTSHQQVEEYRKSLDDRIRTALAARRGSVSSSASALEELRKRQSGS
jgi:hypothetical protein